MWTELRYAFKRFRGQILGWGLGIAALGLLLVPFYDIFLEREEVFLQMIESYPPEVLAFFGGMTAITTPAGFLDVYLSYFPPIVGIFGIIAGSGLLAADEESGRMDLILAHPVSRTGLFFGRFSAFIGAALAIMALSWLGFSIPLGSTSIGLSWGEMMLPFLSLLAQVLVYGTMALLLSMLLPARRLASMTAGLVMVASFFLTGLAELDEDLAAIAQILPHEYYQGGGAVVGLNLTWFFALLGASAVLTLLAWWRFLRRDVRVGGEGGWGFASLLRRRGAGARGDR